MGKMSCWKNGRGTRILDIFEGTQQIQQLIIASTVEPEFGKLKWSSGPGSLHRVS